MCADKVRPFGCKLEALAEYLVEIDHGGDEQIHDPEYSGELAAGAIGPHKKRNALPPASWQ